MSKRPYDSTVARIAGNILSGNPLTSNQQLEAGLVTAAVRIARAIVAEVQRTEPKEQQP